MRRDISRRQFVASMAAVMGVGVSLTESAESSHKPLDDLMVGFLEKHKLPGAALAVGRGGRLLYARGFGWADVDAKKPVRPDSLFRLASISKSITGVAILRAVEHGRLCLDDKIVRWIPDLLPSEIPDARWRDITLRHLLQHTGGWDRDKSFDPMFRAVPFAQELGVEPPAKPEHIIRVMLRRPLDFTPGERYAYSNFGYCLLGRVLERLDGVSYFESVRRRVLCPVGLQRLRLGRTLREFAHPEEVTYYGAPGATGPSVFAANVGQPVPWPYGGWHLEAMDAHGGWIGSAPELVRFAMSLDPQACCPLLSCDGWQELWARPNGAAGYEADGQPKDVHYGLGWMVRTLPNGKINLWHTGSLDGTSTLLVRRHDGFCWAVLFNSRSGFNPETMKNDVTPAKAIDGRIHEAVDATWH